ncbi:hypothetical protein Q9L58_009113 [Maublancomyces gigas]|uniref:Uncharacterized protein n=1 Tax=Discina gigas TaxID=1032678 RepID=A0ABR3G7U7_9PEZI
MYFTSAFLVLAGLSSVASTVAAVSYDDGMYHPDQATTTTTQVTTKATTYVSVISGTSKTSEPSSWYPTLSKSTYVGYWSQNATVTSSYKTTSATSYATHSGANNMTTTKPGNFSMTLTMTDRIYTTTVCDFQSSCYTTVATATNGLGQIKTTGSVQPTMTPFSSSERLIASGWAALVLCGIAVLL